MGRLSPVRIFIVYWIVTLILYAFGPFNWVTYRPTLFWTLNISYILSFAFGWFLAGDTSTGSHRLWTNEDDSVLLGYLGPFLVINLFYEIINLFRSFLFSEFDINELFHRIINGISDMGGAYNDFLNNVDATSSGVIGGSVITLFNYVWEIFAFSTLLLGILYYTRLSLFYKAVSGITIGLVVISFLSRGTNIGVFRIVLAILVFYYIKFVKNSSREVSNGNGYNIKLILIGIVSIITSVVLFDKIMKSRGGLLLWKEDYYNVGGISINHNSVFFRFLPSGFHGLLVSLSAYLSQGYYGMSLSLRVPWKPMWGIGHSMALQRLIGNYVPTIANNSYQLRVEKYGWKSLQQWHTMSSWFANDITYYGVVIIMLLFGIVFRKALNDAVELGNPYAKLMVYFLFLEAVFFPCNNQIAQSTYVLFAFVYVFVKWQLSKRVVLLS